jgi:hypothetical protein
LQLARLLLLLLLLLLLNRRRRRRRRPRRLGSLPVMDMVTSFFQATGIGKTEHNRNVCNCHT